MNVQDRYLLAIRRRVCRQCNHVMEDGICGLADSVCPVEQGMHAIVGIVHHVRDESIYDHLVDIRRVICDTCRHRHAGQCRLHTTGECPLERYLMIVVEAIEDVHEQLAREVLAEEAEHERRLLLQSMNAANV